MGLPLSHWPAVWLCHHTGPVSCLHDAFLSVLGVVRAPHCDGGGEDTLGGCSAALDVPKMPRKQAIGRHIQDYWTQLPENTQLRQVCETEAQLEWNKTFLTKDFQGVKLSWAGSIDWERRESGCPELTYWLVFLPPLSGSSCWVSEIKISLQQSSVEKWVWLLWWAV